ncbi:MAG: ABC transporter substrate-binding protein [Beijerinckiaceae bacterium]|nr:ABC transporter substrate-binding protein [Beijerinckiaceae bacterium]
MVRKLLCYYAIVCGALSGFALHANAQSSPKVVTGVVGTSATQLPLYWAIDQSCDKQNGFEIDVVTVGGGAAQQLTVGAVNVANSGFPDFFQAIARGAPIKMFVNNQVSPPYSIYAKPAITKVADLKGKTLSIGGIADVTLIYMQAFLGASGLTTKDVDFIFAKATNDRLTALISGGVDATILIPPAAFLAEAQGFRNLGEVSDVLKDYPFTVWATNSAWASKNPKLVDAFAKCQLLGSAFINSPANRNETIALISKYTRVKIEDAEKTYNYLVTRLNSYREDGLLTEATFGQMKAGLIQMGTLKEPLPPLSRFFDRAHVDAAAKSLPQK